MAKSVGKKLFPGTSCKALYNLNTGRIRSRIESEHIWYPHFSGDNLQIVPGRFSSPARNALGTRLGNTPAHTVGGRKKANAHIGGEPPLDESRTVFAPIENVWRRLMNMLMSLENKAEKIRENGAAIKVGTLF